MKVAISMEEKRQRVKDRALLLVDNLSSSLYEEDIHALSIRFFSVIHEFFADFCGLRYQFTYPELISEIRKRNLFDDFLSKKVIDFIAVLQEKEYSKTEFNVSELNRCLKGFRLIIKSCSVSTTHHGMHHRFYYLFQRFGFLTAHLAKRFGKRDVDDIVCLINSARSNLDEHNIDQAQKTYEDIIKLYNRLSAEERKSVFHGIHSLYASIEKAYTESLLKQIDSLFEDLHHQLDSGDLAKAAETYSSLQARYDELPPANKKRLYSEIGHCYTDLQALRDKSALTDFDRLLVRIKAGVTSQKVSLAMSLYNEADNLYSQLPFRLQQKVYTNLKSTFSLLSRLS
ncbi:MAG: hypothetical protein V1837_03085 [Candidatus Woesearchaeota archaeon]